MKLEFHEAEYSQERNKNLLKEEKEIPWIIVFLVRIGVAKDNKIAQKRLIYTCIALIVFSLLLLLFANTNFLVSSKYKYDPTDPKNKTDNEIFDN